MSAVRTHEQTFASSPIADPLCPVVYQERDSRVVRGETTGTPVGEFFGARPTGRGFKTMALDMFAVRGEKLASAYHVENWVGAMQQIR